MKSDYDRHAALFLSISVIFLTSGLSLVTSFMYVFSIAKHEECLTSNQTNALIVL